MTWERRGPDCWTCSQMPHVHQRSWRSPVMNISLFYRVCDVLYFISDISMLQLLFICIYFAQRQIVVVVFSAFRVHSAAGWYHTREQAPVHPELQMDRHFTGKYAKVTITQWGFHILLATQVFYCAKVKPLYNAL